MQRSRHFVLIALAMALVLAFAACGKDEEPTTSGGGGNNSEAPSGDLSVVNEGHLTVGSDIPYPPFEFNDDSGALTGFDVEVVRAVADKLGLENTDDDWLSVNFNTIFTQLQRTDRFDIIAAATTAYAPDGSPAAETVAERNTHVDFTEPMYPSLQSLAVDTAASPDITSIDSLPDGARVAVQEGTTGAFYAQEKLTGAELVSFPKAPPMYQALEAGQVVAVFNDLPVTLDAISDKPDLQVVEQVDTGEQYAFAVSKDNPELLDAINGALHEIFHDGTYAQIYKKYFPDQELPDYASE
jgi:polar amino acid transport system substrate-binding protein